jgi:hypothetical protein
MSITKRKPGLPDGVKVWAAGGFMVVEIDSEATAALAEERTSVLAEARNARAGR